MIVRPRPHPIQLIYITRGSILRDIAPNVLAITALACIVVWWAHHYPHHLPGAGVVPFSTIGLALSVFLGFRNNVCYDRWWEARMQWGELIVQARAISREINSLLTDTHLHKPLIYSVIAFAHALTASLRGNNSLTAAQPWLTNEQYSEIQHTHNVPDAILRNINRQLANSMRRGELSDVLYQGLSQRLSIMTAIQAACERINNTPVPFAYSLLLHRTAWMFCLLLPFGLVASLGLMTPFIVTLIAYTFFGLDALGDELEGPFGLEDNHLPLNAMVRIIEIDLRGGLGEQNLPPRLEPDDFVLL